MLVLPPTVLNVTVAVRSSGLDDSYLAWSVFAALLIKESVNQTQDAQGFHTALKACFSIHEANHAHWAEVTKGAAVIGTPEFGVSGERRPIRQAERSSSGLSA